jgi:hypothetical protein
MRLDSISINYVIPYRLDLIQKLHTIYTSSGFEDQGRPLKSLKSYGFYELDAEYSVKVQAECRTYIVIT